jgi:hypothetical protein
VEDKRQSYVANQKNLKLEKVVLSHMMNAFMSKFFFFPSFMGEIRKSLL